MSYTFGCGCATLVEQCSCHIKVGVGDFLLTARLGPGLFSVVLLLSYPTLYSVCNDHILEIVFGIRSNTLVVLLGLEMFGSYISLHRFCDVDVLQVVLGGRASGLFVLSVMCIEGALCEMGVATSTLSMCACSFRYIA
jgi:hypothetical protein